MANILPILLIISGMLLCISATHIYLASKIKNLKSFSYFLMSNAIYVLFFALELKSSSNADAELFINFQYLGLALIPSLWLISSKDLLNIKLKNDKLLNQFLCGISIFLLLIIYTNSLHHLFIKDFIINKIDGLSITKLEIGPLFFLMTFFSYRV